MEELMKSTERTATPVQLTEEAVRAASEGRSEEVLGETRPVQLSEEEVKAAREGKSEEVMKKAASRAGGKK